MPAVPAPDGDQDKPQERGQLLGMSKVSPVSGNPEPPTGIDDTSLETARGNWRAVDKPLLAAHGNDPTRVLEGKWQRVIDGVAKSFEEDFVGSINRLKNSKRVHLLEVCTTPNSGLAEEVMLAGGGAERLSNWNGYDLTTKTGAHRVFHRWKATRARHLWFSPPCTVWTIMQNLNQRTEEQKDNLEARRRKARKILRNIRWIITMVLGEDPTVEVHVEQPRRASSWSQRDFAFLLRTLHVAEPDGCAYGMTDSEGNLLYKPWRVVTSSQKNGRHTQQKALQSPMGCTSDNRRIEASGPVGRVPASNDQGTRTADGRQPHRRRGLCKLVRRSPR